MKHLLWLSFVLVLVSSCSKDEKIVVSGRVEGGTGTIYLDQQGIGGIRKVDSMGLEQDGSFVLKDRIDIPTFYNVHLGDQKIIPLLMHPGESAELNTSSEAFTTAYQISGSPESLLLLDLNVMIARTNKSLDSLQTILDENPDITDELLADLQESYAKIIESQRRYSIQFVLNNLTSLSSIYALYQKQNNNSFVLNTNRDIQLLKVTAACLDTIYPESDFVISLKRDAIAMEESYRNRRLQDIIDAAPSSLPEISLPDPYGDSISLSSLKGNVVILSFWASWDEASIGQNQEFKRLWEKYHERGLEIYQVSFDSELSDWMKSIQYDELPWINVSELSFPESHVALLYNVSEIPAFFLIDRSGMIIGKNFDILVLDRKISELINQK